MKIGQLFAGMLLVAATARAQVGVPVLGYLPDHGRILPVNGIPASASVGPALDFGAGFIQAATSPHQDYVLVSGAASGEVLVAYPDGTTKAVAGTMAYPDGLTMSPAGSAAVLWFASPRVIEIISGLPAAPVVRTVNVSFLSSAPSGKLLSDAPAALGVSDDGAWGAGAWSSGVWAFGPNGEVRSLVSANAGFDVPRSLAFFTGRRDVAVATRTGIYTVTDIGGSATAATLYTAQSLQAPLGLGISADNQNVVMAEAGGNIVSVQAGSGSAAQLPCGCMAESVIPMGGSLFRITGLTGSAFRIFDAKAGSVFLIPLSPGVQAASAAGPGASR